ncbi:hypothetical protein RJT34_30642 [Clitoria ternatea]|uniref:Uncharacterized protein n=1 Tax=Clitoria ternatea TaxID=43366 RepID=A0AAN9F0M3_CLITE
MAFTISRSQSAITEKEKEIVEKEFTKEGISSELHLKSSLSSHQTLDKKAVLRRIRQRRSYNKAKSALEALIGTSDEGNNNTEHKWLQLGDTFSSP